MKQVRLILMAITVSAFIATTTGCSKEEGCTDVTATNYSTDADEDDGSCEFEGEITFWQYSGDGLSTTTVTINGVNKSITADITTTSGPNGCGESANATFKLPVGTYSYTAKENGGANTTWNNNDIVIIKNGCNKRRLSK